MRRVNCPAAKQFQDVVGLKEILVQQQDQFAQGGDREAARLRDRTAHRDDRSTARRSDPERDTR